MPSNDMPCKLKPHRIYSGDNGRLLCSNLRCAGMTAYSTGRDLSGQKLTALGQADADEWFAYFGTPMKCECGEAVIHPTPAK